MRYSGLGDFLFETGLRGAMEVAMDDRDAVLFVDFCRVADKYPMLEQLADGLSPARLLVLDGRDTPAATQRRSRATFIHPPANVYYRDSWKTAPKEAQEALSSFPRLTQLKENFAALNGNYFDRIDSNIISDCVETAFFFAYTTLRLTQPRLMIVWNAFHPLSQAAVAAAKQCDIPVAFMEFGLLPGTLNVDFQGQMGASAVARHARKFAALPVSEAEAVAAEDLLSYLRESGLNRREQHPPGTLPQRIAEAARGRKTVLYAGHNDFSSGVMPWDDVARTHHSPIFARSDEAARHLAGLALAEDFLLVVKPHPFNIRANTLSDGDHVLTLGDENINAAIDACDVTATVLSQTNYIAMIRERPVVMLGRNQLNGSGAAYVADDLTAIGGAIRAALAHGITQDQRAAWLAHVARLSKSYLYRWSPDVPPQIALPDARILGERLAAMLARGQFADAFLSHDISAPSKDKPRDRRRSPSHTRSRNEGRQLRHI